MLSLTTIIPMKAGENGPFIPKTNAERKTKGGTHVSWDSQTFYRGITIFDTVNKIDILYF